MTPPQKTLEELQKEARETLMNPSIALHDLDELITRAFTLGQETEREAFGGCLKCYGKGYSTQLVNEVGAEDFGGEGYETGPQTRMNFCSCERGKQLRAVLQDNH